MTPVLQYPLAQNASCCRLRAQGAADTRPEAQPLWAGTWESTTKRGAQPASSRASHLTRQCPALQRNQSIALKEEYHAFRDRVAMLLVVLAGLLSTGLAYSQSRAEKSARFTLTPPFMVGVQVYLCWVLYSYTAMALRENVLKVSCRVQLLGAPCQCGATVPGVG